MHTSASWGNPIPASRYISPEFMQLEWERMWTKVWLLAGRASDAPEPGDYFTYEIGPESILVVRSVPWAKTGLGKVLFHTQDYAGAAQLFQQVLDEHRMFIEAADWLAKTLEAMGDGAKAQEVLQQAVQLSPNSPVRLKNLGDTAYRNGALDVAQAAFEKTIKISEFSPHKNPAVYARLAQVFSDSNAPDEALKVLKRSKADFKYNTAAALQTAAAESQVERARHG